MAQVQLLGKELKFHKLLCTVKLKKKILPCSLCLCLCLLAQLCPTLQPYGLQPTRLLCPWGFSRQEYWSGLSCPPPGDLSNSGIKPRTSALQVDSLPSEPPGKHMNTGVGSLSLLQGTFLTQELNLSLLHCRWILYQLSYQGSPPNTSDQIT